MQDLSSVITKVFVNKEILLMLGGIAKVLIICHLLFSPLRRRGRSLRDESNLLEDEDRLRLQTSFLLSLYVMKLFEL